MTGFGVRVAVGLVESTGVTVAVRGRGPEKRLKVLIVMFDVTDFPGRVVTTLGFALSEKAGDTPDSLQAVIG